MFGRACSEFVWVRAYSYASAVSSGAICTHTDSLTLKMWKLP